MNLSGGPSRAVLRAAARVPSPAVVYDLDLVTEAVAALRADLGDVPEVTVLFAVKANRYPPVLRHLATLGVGADVAGLREYEAAVEAGMTPITATSPGFDAAALRRLSGLAVPVDISSRSQLEGWIAAGGLPADGEIGLRIRVPVAPVERAGTGVVWSRFGVDAADPELHALLKRHRLTVTRLHAHAGEMMTARRAHALTKALLQCCTAAFPDVSAINIGGGLTGLYADPAEARQAWSAVAAALSGYAGTTGRRLKLIVEPGMLLTALAGYLVVTARGVDAHPGGVPAVTADASGWNLLSWTRPRLVAQVPDRDAPLRHYTLVGNSCYEEDVLVPDLAAGEVQVGDRLVLNAAGAYVTSMARSLHGMEPPHEEVVRGR